MTPLGRPCGHFRQDAAWCAGGAVGCRASAARQASAAGPSLLLGVWGRVVYKATARSSYKASSIRAWVRFAGLKATAGWQFKASRFGPLLGCSYKMVLSTSCYHCLSELLLLGRALVVARIAGPLFRISTCRDMYIYTRNKKRSHRIYPSRISQEQMR